MKIALINTYQKGGAGIAAKRLQDSLLSSGVEATLLIQEPASNRKSVISISDTFVKKLFSKFRLAKDVFRFARHEKNKEDRFQFSPGQEGIDISKHSLVQLSDIIHLHWVNQGFLSIDSIAKLCQTGKPIIWTLHDMWAFTGGCHYSGDCRNFETECKNCPYLRDASSHDLSNKIWHQKNLLVKENRITFVTCSDWLKETAKKSALLKNQKVVSIPNPIDTEAFKPIEKTTARKKHNLPTKKKLLLFGAMNILDKRKGFSYLIKALEILAAKHPESIDRFELVTFGKAESLPENIPFNMHHLGSLKSTEDLAAAYSAVDVFVIPSLQDNLPNTVMESMSCATPVVAFQTGGIPEMVDHQLNGFLAKYKSAEELAEGIWFTGNNSDALGDSARKKIISTYSLEIIAGRYLQLYQEVLS